MDNFFFALIVLGILSFCVMIIVDFIFVLMRKEVRVKYLLIPAVAFIVGFFGFAASVKPSTNSDSVKESQIVEKNYSRSNDGRRDVYCRGDDRSRRNNNAAGNRGNNY